MTREAALSVVLAHVVRNKEDFPTRAELQALRRDCEECCPALFAKPGDLFIPNVLLELDGTMNSEYSIQYLGMIPRPLFGTSP